MQATIAVRENRQRCIITHRSNCLFTGLGHWLQNEFHIFHRPTSHHLAAAGFHHGHSCWALTSGLGEQFFHLLGAANPITPFTA